MKWNRSKKCLLLSAVLAGIFIVKNPLDYLVYSSTLNSAPFWVTVLVNAVYFLFPSAILLTVGLVLGRHGRK